MSTFHIIQGQLFQFFIMIVIGVIIGRTGVVQKDGLNVLSKLLSKVLLSALLLYGTYQGDDPADILASLPVAVAIAGIYVMLIFLFGILSRIVPGSLSRKRIYQALFSFGNAAMIATPLILAACPEHGKLYVFYLIFIDTAFLWTYGIYLASTPGEGGISLGLILKGLLSPTVIAVLLSFALNIFAIRIPALAESTLCAISGSCSPICMLYLGILLYYSDIRKALRRWEVYLGMVVKMLAIPIILGFALRMTGLGAEALNMLVIIAGLPAVTIMPMLAQTYGTEGEYAASVTIVTIGASLITMSLTAFLVMV